MTRYNLPKDGLGTLIIKMSFLLATGQPTIAVVPNENNLVFDLKRIFKIPDDRLTIELGSNGYPDLETDELCTFAPYFTSDIINLFGKDFGTARKKKPCVALVMHHGTGLGDNLPSRSMPYNKFATANEYNQIFDQLSKFGYDVISINSRDIDVEQKTYLLNELCEFVIGYEGGMHHLAHCLGIPSIVLPWKYNDMGHPPVYPGIYYETHRYHADKKTYFLNTIDEFFNLDQTQLTQLLERLHNNQGNNILFDANTYMIPETLEIFNRHMNLTPRICWCETRGEYTTNFIKQHLPLDRMIKYPYKSTT